MKTPKHKLKRKERLGEKYEVSRWTPAVQDIAEVSSVGTGNTIFCTGREISTSLECYSHLNHR